MSSTWQASVSLDGVTFPNASVHIGFTGTRQGLSLPQAARVLEALMQLKPIAVHHGDCVGADADFDSLAKDSKIFRVSHPPDNPSQRAYCETEEVRAPKPYLIRDADIVNETLLLIACPATGREALRSGTWATIRLARKAHRTIAKIWPDGRVEVEPCGG